MAMDARDDVLADVWQELYQQDEKWGQQDHPDGTGPEVSFFGERASFALECVRQEVDHRRVVGKKLVWVDATHMAVEPLPSIWSLILLEEVLEALAETDPKELRKELIQVAAVASQWIEAIDRRGDG